MVVVVTLRGHPRRAPGQQPRGVEVGGQVGERERDALVLDDRLAERLALGRVVAGELERRAARCRAPARRPSAASARTRRASTSGRCPRARLLASGARACRSPPSRYSPGIRQFSNFSSAVCDARQPSFSSLRTMCRPGVPPGTMNSAWPRWPSSGSTVALTTCTSAMPPLPIQILWPSMHPVVAVAAGAGAQVAHVAAALGLGDAERGQLEVARLAEALGRPAQELLGRRRLRHRRQRQRGHHDRQPDPGAAPEQLLHEQRQRQAGRVADQVAVEERVVEALLAPRPRAPATGTPPRGRSAAATGRMTSSAKRCVRSTRSCWAGVRVMLKAHRHARRSRRRPGRRRRRSRPARGRSRARRAAWRRWRGSARRWRRTGGRRRASRRRR